jgi:hypothetical protein
MCVEEALKDPN